MSGTVAPVYLNKSDTVATCVRTSILLIINFINKAAHMAKTRSYDAYKDYIMISNYDVKQRIGKSKTMFKLFKQCSYTSLFTSPDRGLEGEFLNISQRPSAFTSRMV